MPIISAIGRQTVKTRSLITAIYLVLGAGAITMVYPFLLMLSGTTKSNVDTPDAQIIPAFWSSELGLYKKYAEAFFNESGFDMNCAWGNNTNSFRLIELPNYLTENRKLEFTKNYSKQIDDWKEFLQTQDIPTFSWALGFSSVKQSKNVYPENLRFFRDELKNEYQTVLKFKEIFEIDNISQWNQINIVSEPLMTRRQKPLNTKLMGKFEKFASARPLWQRFYFNANLFYVNQYLKSQYTSDIGKYNKTHETNYFDWNEISLSRFCKGTSLQKKDWEDFVRTILNLTWIRITEDEQVKYRQFLKSKYGNIDVLNKLYFTEFKEFDEVNGFTGKNEIGVICADWDAYLQGWENPDGGKIHQASTKSLYVDHVAQKYQDWLKIKYNTLYKLNDNYKTSYSDWAVIQPPQQLYQTKAFVDNISNLRWEFTIRNYYTVLDAIFLNGRAVYNTVIYCSLAIILALIINPLAAYALSRYRPPSTYKILLFLMLTMAFPPMVTQIPVFLMLREFNLLNTFWALVLPGMANGYSIFLLKGFFDSHPKELYEAAEIDGAGEFRIFWQITMSLSTPILAVIALNAFTHAYSNFMMALLICQDQNMWTLMPWLYQLQQESTQGVVFSSLVIAAIPTFMVFVFCQNIIMRGIVVPVEK